MKSSRRDLFIDIVVDRFIFKNNQITLSPHFTLKPLTRVRPPKIGVSEASFSCAPKFVFVAC